MASDHKLVTIDMSPFFRLFSDGSIERIRSQEVIPPSDDPNCAVRSKDVTIDSTTGVSVRIFAPRRKDPPQKLPLAVHIHGGAFCVGSVSSPTIHHFISNLVEKANVIVVSVDYRLAPENPMPIPYEDSWSTFQWIAAHADGKGTDPWLNELADFKRVFLGGDSAGANIANDVAVRAGIEKFQGMELIGLFLLHPYFGSDGEDKLYKLLFPHNSGGYDDPLLNPAVDQRIGRMAVRRVLFAYAEKDGLAVRAKEYCQSLQKSAWSGEVETMETEGEGHCFYLFNPTAEKAVAVTVRLADFLNAE